MEIVFVIALTILAIVSIITLAIVIYNQMLMVNEINKRLLLMAKESQDKERLTMAEYEEHLHTSMNPDAPITKDTVEENEFNPHEVESQM